jgi:8-oxo-dGTP pyrophosphatase MutT (NUDIX family)
VLVHKGRILLIKHKKLGIWLNPGGHIEPNELPHQAAEREFWEETGVKVRAKKFGFMFEGIDDAKSYPSPFVSDLHWVSQENYQARVSGDASIAAHRRYTGRDCEQHLNAGYLMEAVGEVDFSQNVEETDGIAWFAPADIDQLDTHQPIKLEIKEAFRLSLL